MLQIKMGTQSRRWSKHFNMYLARRRSSYWMDSSGITKLWVPLEDRLKTTFQTKCGTYAYQNMPFGLINARETL
jgi:hypothetical protein